MEMIIHEVGMRDGLQIERAVVPTERRSGGSRPSFSRGWTSSSWARLSIPGKCRRWPTRIGFLRTSPSRAGNRRPVILSGLVLNEKGLERGLACGVEQFCMGVSASDTHSRKNTGMSTRGGDRPHHRDGAAKPSQPGKPVQVSVQSAFGCGYEGAVPEERVLRNRPALPGCRPEDDQPGGHRRPCHSGAGGATVRLPSLSSTRLSNVPAIFTIPTGSRWPTPAPHFGAA